MLRCATRWICRRCHWQGTFPTPTCPVCGSPVAKADI